MGSGKSIKIWMDKWPPTPSSYKVTSPPSTLSMDARVEKLIDLDSRVWINDVIKQIFMPREAETIGGIALSSNLPEDKQIWALKMYGPTQCSQCILDSSGDGFEGRNR